MLNGTMGVFNIALISDISVENASILVLNWTLF